ncbi:MAG: DUF1295 domain-containing protein [SAR86 cluster bacterium]|jgi:steroid 5-alpha reductase family enzyme|nr:DUF1295 domain-containing protein [SAR86 cluster bacterium]
MTSKNKDLLICSFIYLFTLLISLCIGYFVSNLTQWFIILAAHLAATCIIFVFSFLLKNSSLYDPFWSLGPLPIVIYLSFWPVSGVINYEKIIFVLLPISYWSYRLTHNWARHWQGLQMEDWRYVDLRKKSSQSPYIIDFFGIHLYPTLQVNFSLFPVYFVLSSSTDSINSFFYLSCIFTFLAVILEKIADDQMRNFKSKSVNFNLTMKQGLWKYSRHPNYLGETLFWWGLYLMAISLNLNLWWLFICPLSMTFMFIFGTCKMMDDRSLGKRSDYLPYMKKTSMIMLWPNK